MSDMMTPEERIAEKVSAAREGREPVLAPMEPEAPDEGDAPEDKNEGELAATPDVEPDAEGVERDTQEAADAAAAADAAEDALPEDATEEEIEAARAKAEEEFYVGRYKTREEAEKALEEKDRTTREALQRAARAEKEMEEMRAAAAEAAQQPLDEESWEEWASESVEEGKGEEAALAALQTGGYEGYAIVLKHWMRADPGAAMVFNNLVAEERAAARANAERSAARTPEDDVLDRNREAAAARAKVAEKYPDYAEVEEIMDEVVDSLDDETRAWMREQSEQGVAGKARVLDYLYLAGRSTKTTKKALATKTERKQRRTSADAAIVSATVAAAEGTAAHTPPSEAEREGNRRKNVLRKRTGQPLLPTD